MMLSVLFISKIVNIVPFVKIPNYNDTITKHIKRISQRIYIKGKMCCLVRLQVGKDRPTKKQRIPTNKA